VISKSIGAPRSQLRRFQQETDRRGSGSSIDRNLRSKWLAIARQAGDLATPDRQPKWRPLAAKPGRDSEKYLVNGVFIIHNYY
jgi:hypothetical protein